MNGRLRERRRQSLVPTRSKAVRWSGINTSRSAGLTKQVHNGTALYSAKFPIAARAGAPIVAAQSVPATDDDELTFNFTKPEVSGTFSGSPAVDIVITVMPNKSKEGHLWLKKAELTSVRNGKVSEADLLANLRRATTIEDTCACLRKASNPR